MSNASNAAAGKEVSFKYRELSFSIPTSENWPIDVIEAIEEDKNASALKALLGEKQWSEFKKHYNTVGDLGALFTTAAAAVSGN